MAARLRPILIALAILAARGLHAAETVETYEGGQTRLRYQTDAQGRKQGTCLEYYPDGKVRIKANYRAGDLWGPYVEHYEGGQIKVKAGYRAGKLHGLYTSYHDSGKVHVKAMYAEGELHGGYAETDAAGRLVTEQMFSRGRLLYPRSRRIIQDAIDRIWQAGLYEPGNAPENPAAAEGARPAGGAVDAADLYALRKLNAYRCLVGVPHDVTLSPEFCDYAKAAADICARIGRLDHRPPNPGMPEEDYRKALHGTTNANLHVGGGTRASVDGYMDDSDPSNISRVGHRRWCVNPSMREVGFGASGRYSAMYAHDRSRKDVPEYDYVAYPAPGYMPESYFGTRSAWSVSLNPARYRRPDKGSVKVAVYPLLSPSKVLVPDLAKRGPALRLDFFNVDHGGFGIPNAIIFRPEGVSTREGSRYWVEISGLKKADGADATIDYLVEFYRL